MTTCKNLLGTTLGDSSRAWAPSFPNTLILPSLQHDQTFTALVFALSLSRIQVGEAAEYLLG